MGKFPGRFFEISVESAPFVCVCVCVCVWGGGGGGGGGGGVVCCRLLFNMTMQLHLL